MHCNVRTLRRAEGASDSVSDPARWAGPALDVDGRRSDMLSQKAESDIVRKVPECPIMLRMRNRCRLSRISAGELLRRRSPTRPSNEGRPPPLEAPLRRQQPRRHSAAAPGLVYVWAACPELNGADAKCAGCIRDTQPVTLLDQARAPALTRTRQSRDALCVWCLSFLATSKF